MNTGMYIVRTGTYDGKFPSQVVYYLVSLAVVLKNVLVRIFPTNAHVWHYTESWFLWLIYIDGDGLGTQIRWLHCTMLKMFAQAQAWIPTACRTGIRVQICTQVRLRQCKQVVQIPYNTHLMLDMQTSVCMCVHTHSGCSMHLSDLCFLQFCGAELFSCLGLGSKLYNLIATHQM